MTDAGLRRAISAACLALLAHTVAAAGGGSIAVARMSGRTSLEASRNLFRVGAKDKEDIVDAFVSAGLGLLRWDGGGGWTGRGSLDGWRRGGEARVHADGGLRVNSGYFQLGAFAACGERGGPALGVRAGGGWQSRHKFFLGAHWEFAAALPGAARGSRAGIGVTAGARL
jgi:hypothetical protein